MKVDVVVLAGGLGTRLRSVLPDLPKPLAPVDGRPFLSYLIDVWAASGAVSRVVLSSGYLAAKIDAFLESTHFSLPVLSVVEAQPLGTGGAVLHVAQEIALSDPFFVLNGDSFLNVDAQGLLKRHLDSGVDATLTVARVDDAGRFGTVRLEGERVSAFQEKRGVAEPAWINAGVYALSHALLPSFPEGASSLERDVLPLRAAEGRLGCWREDGELLDIGLPETLAKAAEFLRRNNVN